MPRYRNLGGNSGVLSYELGDDFIRVTFLDGEEYLYNYESAGRNLIEQMKRLARRGKGLNAFIMKNVYDDYAVDSGNEDEEETEIEEPEESEEEETKIESKIINKIDELIEEINDRLNQRD